MSDQIHNYANPLTILAMMNRNCTLGQDLSGKQCFFKTKSKSKAVVFGNDASPDRDLSKIISWMYLDEDPQIKTSYKMEEIVSVIDSADFFKKETMLKGKKFIEWRGTLNKWGRAMKEGKLEVRPLSKENLEEVLEMIEKWRHLENGGMKYMWQERAGCDKAFVTKIVEDFNSISSRIISQVFYLDSKCIGYSTIQKTASNSTDGLPEVKYLTRKVLNVEGTRNLTEFIDYKTFQKVYEENGYEKFLVNWGASSKGVHWYKTHKFPLYSLQDKWFYTERVEEDKTSL